MDLRRPLATVTPTLDGDVLAVLATHDVAFTTGQIRRILDGFSDEGIRKVLARLENQGVVTADRVGNAYAYRLNHNHLAARAIVDLAKLASTFLARLEAALEDWAHPPAYAAVFGSAARGTMTFESDIDLLLVRADSAVEAVWSQQVTDLAAAVTRWTGNDTRTVEFSVAELRSSRGEPVLRDVVDHGLTVAGTRAWLLKQLRPVSRVGD